MIQSTLLLISWMTFPIRSNQHSDEAEFSNASLDYEIFDSDNEIYNSDNSKSTNLDFHPFEVSTIDSKMLTDNLIELVPFIVLQRHNHIRRVYNLPILKLSAKLTDLCKTYAEKHASGEISLLVDYPLKYGFNVYYGERSHSNPNYVMQIWSKEVVCYNSNDSNENNMKNMPHVHQILWKDTQALGVCITPMEYTQVETFLLYILYDPPGTAVEEFEENFPISDIDNVGVIFHQKPFFVLLHLYLLYRFQNCIDGFGLME